jgi:hypothetical protein
VSDLFEEVEEQLRSDRYRTLARKALPWVLGLAAAVLVAALAYWGWTHYREQTISKASEQYAAGLTALEQGRADEATKLFTSVSQSSAKAYKALALMQLAGVELSQKHTDAAVRYLDQAAARGDFVIISGMLDAPEGARTRAKAAIGLIDSGSATAVPETVRAAAALPPTALAPAQPPQPQAPGPQ